MLHFAFVVGLGAGLGIGSVALGAGMGLMVCAGIFKTMKYYYKMARDSRRAARLTD